MVSSRLLDYGSRVSNSCRKTCNSFTREGMRDWRHFVWMKTWNWSESLYIVRNWSDVLYRTSVRSSVSWRAPVHVVATSMSAPQTAKLSEIGYFFDAEFWASIVERNKTIILRMSAVRNCRPQKCRNMAIIEPTSFTHLEPAQSNGS